RACRSQKRRPAACAGDGIPVYARQSGDRDTTAVGAERLWEDHARSGRFRHGDPAITGGRTEIPGVGIAAGVRGGRSRDPGGTVCGPAAVAGEQRAPGRLSITARLRITAHRAGHTVWAGGESTRLATGPKSLLHVTHHAVFEDHLHVRVDVDELRAQVDDACRLTHCRFYLVGCLAK